MIKLGTTERFYPWGVLRSTHASKVKFVLAEKGLPWAAERIRPGDPDALVQHKRTGN